MKLTDSVHDQIDARLQGIAAELFGPSSDTLAAVALGGDDVLRALPAQLQERLKAPELVRQLEVMRNTLAEGEDVDRMPYLPTPSRGAEPLARGQIRVVEGVDLNDPQSERRYTEPVLVLLDRPVVLDGDAPAGQSVVWQGWTVSRHAGFAGYWDVLMQGADVPQSCAMVQVWNVARVADLHLGRCRYRLSAEQQAAVDAVWLEFLSGVAEPGAKELGLEGQITAGIRLTRQGQYVVTGSPSIGPEDPRFLFQQFYGLVREALGAACERAVAEATAEHGLPIVIDDDRKPAVLEPDPADAFERFLSRLGVRTIGTGSTVKRRARSLALVAVAGLGAVLVIQQQTRPDPDEVVMRGASIVIRSSDPVARCRAIETNLLAVGLKKGVQVLISEDDKQRQCRVAVIDLDDERDRVAAAAAFDKEGLKVEVAGRLEVTIVKRD